MRNQNTFEASTKLDSIFGTRFVSNERGNRLTPVTSGSEDEVIRSPQSTQPSRWYVSNGSGQESQLSGWRTSEKGPGRAATIEMVRRRQHEMFEPDGTPRRRADVENQVFAPGSRLAQPDDSHLRTHWPAPEDDCTFPVPRLRNHELDVKGMRRVRGFPPGYKCYNCKALGRECPDMHQYNDDCAVWQIFVNPGLKTGRENTGRG
ncbi:hypothetical protein NM208_g4522 [Fusarium decemcellulare]|uniref:Uncharacterized protein n=1 Tax=Fusarium decemcellulare TaxID=57161 RepID=A0ACC1SKR6_9HYPO|nr:hypothetical protein NM208_g4522 [Fusarium decemcellulare]